MKILVTGATGFIGQNLIKNLIKKNYLVSAILREKSNQSKINSNINIFNYNGNIIELENFFIKNKFDGIIHLASCFLAEHDKSHINDLIDSNIKFGTELLEASKTSNVKWFINTGTFWQNFNNTDYNPVNLYAATKEAFLDISKYYTQTSDLIFTTIKLNDTFGENDTRKKIFNLWKELSESKNQLKMSKGEQLIDILYIDDVINAYEILISYLNSNKAKEHKEKVYTIHSKERMSLKELANLFEKVTKKKLNILWGERKYRNREVMVPLEKGSILPGWEQKVSLETAIKKTLGHS